MSSLWTPSGERPVEPEPRPARQGPSGPAERGAQPTRGAQPAAGPRPAPGMDEETALSEEEMRAQMEEVQRELAQTPARVVVVNHCIGLFQLAALHLNQQPPNLDDAKLAIDAMGAVVEMLGPRLDEDFPALQEALASVRLAFVQIQGGGAPGDPPG